MVFESLTLDPLRYVGQSLGRGRAVGGAGGGQAEGGPEESSPAQHRAAQTTERSPSSGLDRGSKSLPACRTRALFGRARPTLAYSGQNLVELEQCRLISPHIRTKRVRPGPTSAESASNFVDSGPNLADIERSSAELALKLATYAPILARTKYANSTESGLHSSH